MSTLLLIRLLGRHSLVWNLNELAPWTQNRWISHPFSAVLIGGRGWREAGAEGPALGGLSAWWIRGTHMLSLARSGPERIRRRTELNIPNCFLKLTTCRWGQAPHLQGVQCMKGKRERDWEKEREETQGYINQVPFTGRKHSEWERSVFPLTNIYRV